MQNGHSESEPAADELSWWQPHPRWRHDRESPWVRRHAPVRPWVSQPDRAGPGDLPFRESTAAAALMRSDSSLKRPQEINDVLLLLSSQPIETFDDLICLAAIALVISNDFHQVGRPSIMEEED